AGLPGKHHVQAEIFVFHRIVHPESIAGNSIADKYAVVAVKIADRSVAAHVEVFYIPRGLPGKERHACVDILLGEHADLDQAPACPDGTADGGDPGAREVIDRITGRPEPQYLVLVAGNVE